MILFIFRYFRCTEVDMEYNSFNHHHVIVSLIQFAMTEHMNFAFAMQHSNWIDCIEWIENVKYVCHYVVPLIGIPFNWHSQVTEHNIRPCTSGVVRYTVSSNIKISGENILTTNTTINFSLIRNLLENSYHSIWEIGKCGPVIS